MLLEDVMLFWVIWLVVIDDVCVVFDWFVD